ncbi:MULTISPECIES: DUF5994 family protein [unclassified Mycobacterium]|uniref:DUF5994 family protein n=1 Tax=unclassified Mycobacterium TaxID=2642494 RepID=UPI00274200D8|nr:MULTISPECIES: DUF5994 family protein [unclassified Mycobacterium]MDP7703625.1 DUF5994 family protein [Mycobacterium sp. TY815]MDP7722107.1 DUF5994 family protein [Mycobacterium sp. TY814]
MTRRPTRLEIKPFRPISEHVDGAWWPRSTRLVDELPGLVTSLADELGPIAMVGYHRNSWDSAPPVLEIGGRTIELLGFSGDEPASIILIGQDGHHLSLQVIPPDTGERSGEQALQEARSGADDEVNAASRSLVARSVADVAEKLAQHEGRGDQQRTAALRPQIRQWCEQAAQQFIDAPVQTFVPILVEHIVRGRLMDARVPAQG